MADKKQFQVMVLSCLTPKLCETEKVNMWSTDIDLRTDRRDVALAYAKFRDLQGFVVRVWDEAKSGIIWGGKSKPEAAAVNV
jgi:hypothetical protein